MTLEGVKAAVKIMQRVFHVDGW